MSARKVSFVTSVRILRDPSRFIRTSAGVFYTSKDSIMYNNVIVFGKSNVRINNVDGEYWFCLKDVLAALGTKTEQSHIVWDDEDEVLQKHPIQDSLGRTQNTNFISEAGLYELLGKVNSETAKPFRRWVTHEVLPSLRKTGSYNLNNCKTPYGQIADIPDAVAHTISVLKSVGYSDGILKSELLERDLAHYNATGSHFLGKKALEEARDAECRLSFNRSCTDTTKEAAIYSVADFNYIPVSAIAKRYKNKKITSTLVNKILEEAGYQIKVGKGKYIKTDLSRDLAVARTAESGATKGMDIINGWRVDSQLEKFLGDNLAAYIV